MNLTCNCGATSNLREQHGAVMGCCYLRTIVSEAVQQSVGVRDNWDLVPIRPCDRLYQCYTDVERSKQLCGGQSSKFIVHSTATLLCSPTCTSHVGANMSKDITVHRSHMDQVLAYHFQTTMRALEGGLGMRLVLAMHVHQQQNLLFFQVSFKLLWERSFEKTYPKLYLLQLHH